ncbi:hypothetical protein BJ970_004730 [Saccharopolyspora phatthalungensis]|uniref:Uncharacterized protein n=1 Tax=Saccharopolyspora phatthalungensis TaxID=664693 RepID=A0A840Q9T7_9PSEU|nr:hypothetical protein [Saccharopolyspora phatthalungensis]
MRDGKHAARDRIFRSRATVRLSALSPTGKTGEQVPLLPLLASPLRSNRRRGSAACR